jgi:serine/threonine protein kinase/tetratricopeptide (TPR) repeat protein
MNGDRMGRVRLREFEIDLRTGELFATAGGDSRKILLRQQPLEVLRILIEAGGQVVSRQEIKKRLWSKDTNVNFDHSINVAIGNLRRVMGDSAEEPQYIETLARRGYRLRAPIEWVEREREDGLPSPNSLIGRKVSHYRVLEFVGAGGMGMVYKAEDLKLARLVALKFLPEELANDPTALKHFQCEAQMASALNHPNICTVYQVDEYEGQPFIAMELLEGVSLLHRIANPDVTPGPLGLFLDIAIQICDGLQAAHDEGIIHLDLKPGNLFLTRRGHMKILDFGLAKAASSDLPDPREASEKCDNKQSVRIPTASDAVVSCTEPAIETAAYMSPEQLRKEHLDPRTDLFSLGVVFYEMTTGRRPFEGDTPTAVKLAILTQTLLPANEVSPAVPRRLGAIIAKATEKDRSRRHQSAAELRADLENVRQEIELTKAWKGKWLVVIFAALTFGIGILWRSLIPMPAPLSSNETIVIGISNQTRDPVFSNALFDALRTAMEQTPYFTLLPISKATTALGTLHLSGDPMKLSPQTARRVCVQTGSNLAIVSSIAEAGNGFGLKLQAIDCQSGRTIAAASRDARSRTQVVHALGLTAVELRAKLGEPAASVARFNKPLETAESASPDALDMLLEGYKRHLASDLRGAVSNYQRALDLDPNLAAGLTALASAQDFLGDEASSIAAITKAYEMRDRLTDPVRSVAEGIYFHNVTGEREKECAILSQSVRRFPGDFRAHNNFRVCLESIGQQDRALAEAREAARLVPSPFSYHAVIFLAIITDRLDEAEADLAEADAQKFDTEGLRYFHALVAFLRHDNSKMQEEWRLAAAKPPRSGLILQKRALAEAYYGHYRNYRYLAAQARDLFKKDMLLDSSWVTAEDALTEAEAGNLAQALRLAEDGRTGPQYRVTQPMLALAFARGGQIARAEELADSLNKNYLVSTEVQNYLLPTIEAAIKIHTQDPAGAIKLLERTRKYDFADPYSFGNLYPSYVRGLAYLQVGEVSLAKAEFQKLLDHPGIVGLNVIGALSRLQLARALRTSGDAAAARELYEDFLGLWKEADPDIPIYQEAKAEYAGLMSARDGR